MGFLKRGWCRWCTANISTLLNKKYLLIVSMKGEEGQNYPNVVPNNRTKFLQSFTQGDYEWVQCPSP